MWEFPSRSRCSSDHPKPPQPRERPSDLSGPGLLGRQPPKHQPQTAKPPEPHRARSSFDEPPVQVSGKKGLGFHGFHIGLIRLGSNKGGGRSNKQGQ